MQKRASDKAYRVISKKSAYYKSYFETDARQTTLYKLKACQVRLQRSISDFRAKRRDQSLDKLSKFLSNNRKPRSELEQECLQVDMDFVRKYADKYQDFLPVCAREKRDELAYHLQVEDMIEYRKKHHIPEFYVGSILSVRTHAPEDRLGAGENHFVGICIWRRHRLKKHTFCLRNHVDGVGFEIEYHLYSPKIKSIEVLKLQKWLDDDLNYLRDCHPRYSTFDFQMAKIPHSREFEVPLFEEQIPIGPKPWQQRWFLRSYLNLQPIEIGLLDYNRLRLTQKPWDAFDLLKIHLHNASCETLERKLRYIKSRLE